MNQHTTSLRSHFFFLFGIVSVCLHTLVFDECLGDTIYVSGTNNVGIRQWDSVTGQSSTFNMLNGVADMIPDGHGGLYAIRSTTLYHIDASGQETVFATGLRVNSYGLAMDSNSNIYVANGTDSSIQKVDSTGVVSVFSEDDLLNEPFDLIFDDAGNLYASNTDSHQILKINGMGQASIFASGLNSPMGMVFDNDHNLYVANNGNDTIAKIDPSGNVDIFASTGDMHYPWDPAFDSDGNLYVVSYWSTDVLKITPEGDRSVFATMPYNQPKFITIVPEPATWSVCILIALPMLRRSYPAN